MRKEIDVWTRYLEGEPLSGVAEVDPSLRAELQADLRTDGMLRGLALEDKEPFVRGVRARLFAERVRARLKRRRIPWGWATAAAVLVVFVAAAAVSRARRSPVRIESTLPKGRTNEIASSPSRDLDLPEPMRFPESEEPPPVAVVELGEVVVLGPSGREPARPGRGLSRGTRLETIGEARIRLPSEASLILSADSEIRFESELQLTRGRVIVHAAATEVRVRASVETRVDVVSGVVAVAPATGREAVRVRAGCYVVVESAVDLEIRSDRAQRISIPVREDTTISESAPRQNYGNSTTLWVDGRASRDGKDRAMLLRWDLSSIPRRCTILSASIEVDVVDDGKGQAYGVYALRSDWGESTATWGLGRQRGAAKLGELAPKRKGPYLVKLNAPGVRQVQAWVERASPNFGFLIADPMRTNAVGIHSREATNPESRPRLVVTYLPQ